MALTDSPDLTSKCWVSRGVLPYLVLCVVGDQTPGFVHATLPTEALSFLFMGVFFIRIY